MLSSASTSLPSIMSLRDAIVLLRRLGGDGTRTRADPALDLGAEMTQETLHRPRGAFAEGTDRVTLDLLCHLLQEINLRNFRVAALHAREHAPHPAAPFATRRTLPAALVFV